MHTIHTLILGSFVATLALPASAATLTFASYSGSLGSDDSIALFDFTVDAPGRVGIRTLSYGGGLLADGTEIPPGGFDPILTLFDSNSNVITANDDHRDGRTDPTTGSNYDSRIVSSLNPGRYTVAVSQYDNFYISDNGRFERQGEPNFTSLFGCSAGQFCDTAGNSRTNRWVAEVPEPSTILGSGLVLGFLGWFRHWQRRRASLQR